MSMLHKSRMANGPVPASDEGVEQRFVGDRAFGARAGTPVRRCMCCNSPSHLVLLGGKPVLESL